MHMNFLQLFFITLITSNYLFAEWNYVTIPPGADPSVSAEDGGNGFENIAEELGYQTYIFPEDEIKYLVMKEH